MDEALDAVKRGERRPSRQEVIDPEVSVLVDAAKEKAKQEMREKLVRAVKITMSESPAHNTASGKWWEILKGAQRTM